MKHSVFTVVLPELTIEEQAKAIAKWGYDGVEWRVASAPTSYNPGEPFNFWRNRAEDVWVGNVVEEAPRLRRLAEENGLTTAALAGYSQCSDTGGMKALAEACEAVGARFFRVLLPVYEGTVSYNTLYKEALRDLGRAAQMAAERGVRACIELHPGTIHPSAGLALRLVENFDPASVGVIYDAGNLTDEGYEETKMALELLGTYLAYVHVKDRAWARDEEEALAEGGQAWVAAERGQVGRPRGWRVEPVTLGEGVGNWPKVISVLKGLGYDGWLSNEDFRPEPATEEKLRQDLRVLKRLETAAL
jgi:sugar phosphate isomerase/epimerase